MIIIAAVLAVRLFAHSHYANINTFEESDTSANSDVIWEDMHLKLKALVGRWVITKIGSSKKDISWAITSPLNRMGVLTLAHGAAFTVLLALLPFSADISHETVMYIFLAISPLAMLLDVRKNTPQLRGLAHHYGADGMFKSLQVNILFGYYKLMLKDTCLLSAIMISTIILCGYLFDVTMLFFIFAVQLTALLWAPALLLCRWDRVNLALVAGVIAYLSSLLSAHHLISLTQSSDNNAALLGAIVCLAFTVISGCQVYMYKQSHLERLLR
ncbi:hypothetical protein [Aestuariibacter salexigens]|uniref:hypothetical protein n=1 Tax=Aestuariibacter salexigens TaxID=226010 RepID=UPI0012EB3F35|nr:hypothetical protein [Aestuariibacter salexigens]